MATCSSRPKKNTARWNFDVANTGVLLRHFEEAEAECANILDQAHDDPKTGKRIIMAHPAYDQCIKASHIFNLLDARGVISVTERQAYIGSRAHISESLCRCLCANQCGWSRSMRLGQFLAGFTVFSALLAGGAMYYLQVYAFYEEVSAQGEDVRLVSLMSGEPEPILFENFQAIDGSSSPIRYRACFTTEMSHALLTETYVAFREGGTAQCAGLV